MDIGEYALIGFFILITVSLVYAMLEDVIDDIKEYFKNRK